MNFEDKELAEWLETTARGMLMEGAESAAVVYRRKDETVMSGYLRASVTDKAGFAFCIQQDAMLDTLRINPEILRDVLKGGGDDAEA